NALGQTRMEVGGGTLDNVPWYNTMSESTVATMRQNGREVLEQIRQYLAAGAPDAMLANAIRTGKEYAVLLHGDGMTLPDAVRGFLYFSDFVINAILTWSEIATPRTSNEWSALLRHVNAFINTMLLSVIEYYEEE